MIRFLVKEMRADRLFTLTYRENMQDRERLMGDFTRFLRLVRKALKRDWPYVAVVERQERGAFHIHCAVIGWQNIKVLRRCWYQALGGTGDETGDKTPGQIDVTPPRGRWGSGFRCWQSSKLGGYLVKYLHKTFDEVGAEKKRYWHSQGLKAPELQRIWLGGCSNPTEAMKSTVSTLQTFYGLRGADWDMWLSPDWTTFWLSGEVDPLEGVG